MKGRRAPILALLLALLLVLPGCEPLNQALAAPALDEDFSLSDIPAFSGQPYVVVGDNTPQFPEEDLVPVSFEDYSPLDGLGRCGTAYACVSLDTMPTEARGSIGQVKPSGWHTANTSTTAATSSAISSPGRTPMRRTSSPAPAI